MVKTHSKNTWEKYMGKRNENEQLPKWKIHYFEFYLLFLDIRVAFATIGKF